MRNSYDETCVRKVNLAAGGKVNDRKGHKGEKLGALGSKKDEIMKYIIFRICLFI